MTREKEDVYVRYALSLHQQIGRLTNALAYKRMDVAEYEKALSETRANLAEVEKRMGEMRY
ncbi:hypothetical protein [Paenibacillus terrae]|uniref:hypothetical protein n=1 Tax=Paenibacillus terrae TaxID=159743 RepID=UPI0011EAD981|nr:hypothetical protein [Paenibacillus terrae]